MPKGVHRKHWIQLSLFVHATDGEKEILRTILSTHKKEMSTRQLRARTEVDLYLEASAIHGMCNKLVQKKFIQLVRRERVLGESGRAHNVYKVTPDGVEALQWII